MPGATAPHKLMALSVSIWVCHTHHSLSARSNQTPPSHSTSPPLPRAQQSFRSSKYLPSQWCSHYPPPPPNTSAFCFSSSLSQLRGRYLPSRPNQAAADAECKTYSRAAGTAMSAAWHNHTYPRSTIVGGELSAGLFPLGQRSRIGGTAQIRDIR